MTHNCEYCERKNQKAAVRQRLGREDMIAALADTAALRDAFRRSVCAYADYSNYHDMLLGLLECFDESHEDYDPDSWLSLATGAGQSDSLYIAGYEAIEAAEEILNCIENRAERGCKTILRTVLSAPTTQQNKILGRSFKLRESDIDAFVDAFFENAYELDFSFDADANYDVFIAAVLYELGEFFTLKPCTN